MPSSGRLSRRVEKRLHILREKGDVFARRDLPSMNCESTGSADARNRRRRKGKGETFAEPGELFVQSRFDGGVLFLRLRPFAPGLEGDKEERAVSIVHQAEQTESDDAGGVLARRAFC